MSLTPRLSFLLPSRVRIRVVLLAVFGAIVLGTVMFHLLEGWSILDSLYVTAQTVTTVGFGDFTVVTDLGRRVAVIEAVIGQVFIATTRDVWHLHGSKLGVDAWIVERVVFM